MIGVIETTDERGGIGLGRAIGTIDAIVAMDTKGIGFGIAIIDRLLEGGMRGTVIGNIAEVAMDRQGRAIGISHRYLPFRADRIEEGSVHRLHLWQ